METLLKLLCLATVCYCIGKARNVHADLTADGANVCSYEETAYKTKVVSTMGVTYFRTSVQTCCNSMCWSYCYRMATKTKTKLMYRKMTVSVMVKRFYCCSGWTKDKSDANGCREPICSVSCQNGGRCVKPDTCKCPKGFKGKYCQNDINECNDPRINKCGQSCINTHGSFKCGCKRGFQRADDGVSCIDIDECQHNVCKCKSTTGPCKATCKNSPGSYSCSCSKGYEQRIPGLCQDRNECIEDSNICDHKCVNVEGSYSCSCFAGYARNETSGKCEDINECANGNGGCSHNCHNLIGGSTCSCPDGFYLGKDRRTCKQINSTDNPKYMCEGDFVTLTCKVPNRIGVLYAMYGRLSVDKCKTGNYTTSNTCQFKGVLPYLARRCDNKSFCAIFASTSVFVKGTYDPCPNTSKYLHIVYRCVPPETTIAK